MKSLVIAFTIAMLTAASAQGIALPQTAPLTDTEGKVIGTATTLGGRVYLRDLKGEHFATIMIGKDGTRMHYDPSGKVLDKISAPGKPQ